VGSKKLNDAHTAVLRVLSDILQPVDRGDSTALVLLDLSAVFDTVDHSILLQRLQTSFDINENARHWFQSYLSGRSQYVRRGPTKAKGKASSLDIAPLTILNSGALQPGKWQLTGNDCSIAAQAVAAQRPR